MKLNDRERKNLSIEKEDNSILNKRITPNKEEIRRR